MFKLNLFFIVLYYIFVINVDSVFVSKKYASELYSLSSQKKTKNTRIFKNNFSFINNYNINDINCKTINEFSHKYNKFQHLVTQLQDSLRNPFQKNTKLYLSILNEPVVETVNCSGLEICPEQNFVIPYDHIHTLAFDGHESLREIISTLNQPLHQISQKILLDHKFSNIELGATNFEARAFRSIKSLTYWIGSKMLNVTKNARHLFDLQGLKSPEHSIAERTKCKEIIMKFVSDNLDNWYSNSKLDAHRSNLSFPSFEMERVEDYVKAVWRYLNNRVFQNLLPEFWEIHFGWFDITDEKYRNILTESGEVFVFEETNRIDFPKFMYPTQLKSSPSALSNCIFRSMVKFLCDAYSAFGGLDYIDVVCNAFKFIDSGTAQEEGVNFTVVQRSYESLVNYDSDKMSFFNSRNIFSKEYDLNDRNALFLNTSHVPYIKNNFHLLSVFQPDSEDSLKLYESSFKPHNEGLSRDIWFRNGKLTIPMAQISKTLLNGDLDGFSHLIALALNYLMQLKPLQLNFIQNRIVSLCIKYLNSLRSLEAYASNYELEQDSSALNKSIEKLNVPMIQSLLFTMNLHEKCVTNNDLYPLSNDFIRQNQLEELLDLEHLSKNSDSNVYETSVYKKFMNQKEQEPVKFINEYLDSSVSSDDQDALRFLVNYYNFNLFGGRLPIDIQIKFKYMDYLSSNDVSSVVLTPTIYINPIFKSNKKIICRLILNECVNIFLKWSNKFVYKLDKQAASLNDILEYRIEDRIREHILNCSESSLSWPFYLDDFALSDRFTYSKTDMNKIFNESFEKQDVVKVLDDFIKRESVSDMWKEKKLPIRDFLCSLFSGVYDLSYGILANPASIQVTSKLDLNDLNYLENKFKHVCDQYYSLNDSESNSKSSVLYLEALSIVESAFDELREECIKNTLIYTNDLVESISNVTKVLTNSVQVHEDHSSVNLDESNRVRTTSPSSADLELDDHFIGDSEKITNEDALNICYLLFLKYNKFLFHDFLPEVEIRFEDIDELSSLKIDLTDFSKPVILINKYIDDINLLNSQLVFQMVYLSYFYFRHVTSEEFLGQFGQEFKSAFNVVHYTRTNFLKSKLIPVNLEKKLNATKDKKDHNKEYVDFINKTLDYKPNDLVTLRVNDFVYEVLEGREKFNHNDKFSNYYESLQTLKAFAYHYFNTLSNSSDIKNRLIHESVTDDTSASKDEGLANSNMNDTNLDCTTNTIDGNCVNESVESNVDDELSSDSTPSLNYVLDVFSPAMMKNQWIITMMQQVERRLKEKNIHIFVQPPNNDWQSLLSEKQYELFIKYVSNHPDETLFRMLTNSNALNKREAVDFIVQSIRKDPRFAQKNLASAFSNSAKDTGPVTSTPTVEVLRDDTSQESSSKRLDVDDFEDFFNEEMAKVLDKLPPNEHDTFIFFIHKLLDGDFASCRNILNSHSSPSFLIDKSDEIFQSINSHNIIDSETYETIKQFLHR